MSSIQNRFAYLYRQLITQIKHRYTIQYIQYTREYNNNPKNMQAAQSSKVIGEQLMNLNRVSSKPSGGHCGYCDKYQSYSWGFTKQIMHPYTYQLLAERGWRRCGFYYYKPDVKQSCCKLWTHRMDVNKYRIKKDQRKTIKHVVQWLNSKVYGIQSKKKMEQQPKKQIKKQENMKNQNKFMLQKGKQHKQKGEKIVIEIPQKWIKIVNQSVEHLTKIIQTHKQQFFSLISRKLISDDQQHDEFQYVIDSSKLKCFASQPNANSDFYCNYLMLLFGLNKIVFKKQYNCIDFVKDITQFVEGHLNQKMEGKVLVQVQRSGYLLFTQCDGQKMERRKKIEEQMKRRNSMEKKQNKQLTQNKQKNQLLPKNKMQPQGKHPKKQQQKNDKEDTNPYFPLIIQSQKITFGPLSIIIVPAEVTKQSWKMYQSYSTQIHQKAQKSQSSYSGFLCEKALKFIQDTTQKPSQKQYLPSWQLENPHQHNPQKIKGKRTKLMGCYHMKYYIDKQFIGVGVVDFFPDGLSSVYFFYEPKYKDQRLGVFSSLIQIEYVRWLSLSFPEYKNYYMGFYIQNCVKMSYKGNYQPFDLLCPITYQFVECTPQMIQLIDKIQKRQVQSVQLSKNNNKIDDVNFQTDIGVYINQKVKIKYQGQMLTLKDLNPRIMITILGMLRDMVQVWGKHLFQSFTFTF